MSNPTAEQLEQWSNAGALFEGSEYQKRWFGPYFFGGIYEDGRHILGSGMWTHVRPYRAPGHIQPHDGAAERPEHVAVDDRVAVRYSSSWTEVPAYIADWAAVDYYIVLPRIEP